jgi:hypothetical protein
MLCAGGTLTGITKSIVGWVMLTITLGRSVDTVKWAGQVYEFYFQL